MSYSSSGSLDLLRRLFFSTDLNNILLFYCLFYVSVSCIICFT